MKRFALLVFLVLPAFAAVQCPAFQHDNGAGACEFNNYLDTPAFLTSQNATVANALNTDPTGPGAAFAHQYGSLPINQQMAIMSCQLSIFNNSYFAQPAPSGCPSMNGQLNTAAVIAANPAASNPGNQPSVTWNGTEFVPVVPPQPGPAVTIVPAPPPPATGNMVGALDYATSTSQIYFATPAAMKDSMTPAVLDGEQVTENGQVYTAHVVRSLMGLEVFFTQP